MSCRSAVSTLPHLRTMYLSCSAMNVAFGCLSVHGSKRSGPLCTHLAHPKQRHPVGNIPHIITVVFGPLVHHLRGTASNTGLLGDAAGAGHARGSCANLKNTSNYLVILKGTSTLIGSELFHCPSCTFGAPMCFTRKCIQDGVYCHGPSNKDFPNIRALAHSGGECVRNPASSSDNNDFCWANKLRIGSLLAREEDNHSVLQERVCILLHY
jgi:hypothetical protein